MGAFATRATVSCSTKRIPAEVSGKIGAPAEYLTGLSCTPLDPVDPEHRPLPLVDSPHELLQTFLEGDPDIVEGDLLTVSGTDYTIRSVADWVWQSDVFRHLIIEEIKG